MRLLDAVIEIARSDAGDEWARYCEIAPRVWPVPDAAQELLALRLKRGGYDSAQRGGSGAPEAAETVRLEEIFLERFAAAVHAGRCSVWGVPRGEPTATMIDPVLITVEAFKRTRGDQEWELAGAMWYGIDVIVGPPPISKLRPASEQQVHDAIKAEYEHCAAIDAKPPNVKEVREPVQSRLRAKGLDASLKHIQDLAGDKRYAGLRRKPGKTVASEQRG
jgi:hypothetical protein